MFLELCFDPLRFLQQHRSGVWEWGGPSPKFVCDTRRWRPPKRSIPWGIAFFACRFMAFLGGMLHFGAFFPSKTQLYTGEDTNFVSKKSIFSIVWRLNGVQILRRWRPPKRSIPWGIAFFACRFMAFLGGMLHFGAFFPSKTQLYTGEDTNFVSKKSIFSIVWRLNGVQILRCRRRNLGDGPPHPHTPDPSKWVILRTAVGRFRGFQKSQTRTS